MAILTINVDFEIGELVYHKTDPDQLLLIVTDIKICGDGGLLYFVNRGANETTHYAVELSREKVIQ